MRVFVCANNWRRRENSGSLIVNLVTKAPCLDLTSRAKLYSVANFFDVTCTRSFMKSKDGKTEAGTSGAGK